MKLSKPSFCFITPNAYLEQFASQSNTHLVLAHLVDQNQAYAYFYQRMAARGDLVIMDNSAYELKLPYSPDKLIDLAKQCGAQCVVLPDYPFQPSQTTVDAAIQFIPQFKDAGLKTFFVPQSKTGDLEDWVQAYVWASNNNNIDVIGLSILGVPNALPNVDPSFARVVMTQLLIDRGLFNFNKHHHYLGLNSGPALEIPSLLRMNVLDTIDSSGPVWAGLLGHSYTDQADSYQQISKIKLPVDFDTPMTKDQATIDRIQRNINMTNKLFTDPGNNKVWYAQE